jgi:peptidoglycan/LPS O-acetylase OafA/YrhL
MRDGHLNCLDGWRGLAILLVLAGHFLPLGSGGTAGAMGVELFFVLSGRLMAEILILRRAPLGRFVRRRMTRILPAFAAFILICCAMILPSVPPSGQERVLVNAAGALLFVSNYMIVGHDFLTVFQHSWSLAVEEHSYLLLALLAFLTGRAPVAAMRIAALVAVAAMANGIWQCWGVSDTTGIYARTDVRAASILLSFALCLWLRQRRLPHRLLPWIAPAGIAAALAIAASGAGEMVLFTVGTLSLAVAVNTLEHSVAPLRRLFEERVLRWFGLVSFSLYLWQQPGYAARLDGTPALLCLAFALLCGTLSFYGIERPARRYLNARGAAGPEAAETADARAAQGA